MRIGLVETTHFCMEFFDDVKPETFLKESAGVADLITSCKCRSPARANLFSTFERKSC